MTKKFELPHGLYPRDRRAEGPKVLREAFDDMGLLPEYFWSLAKCSHDARE